MKLINSLLLCLLAMSALSQRLKTGFTYEDAYYNYAPQIIGQNDSTIFVADQDRDIAILESYNKNDLSRNFYVEVETGAQMMYPVAQMVLEIFYTEGYIVMFSAMYNYATAYSELYMHRINAQTGKVETHETLIAQSIDRRNMKNSSGKRFNTFGNYKVVTSENKKRTVVKFAFRNYERNRIYEYLIVYDEHMRKIKQKEFAREWNETVIPNSMLVDEEGSIYFLRGRGFVFLDYFLDYEEWNEPLPEGEFASNARPTGVTASFNNQGNLVVIASYLSTDIEDTEENKLKEDTKEDDTQLEGVMYIELDCLNKEMAKFEFSRFTQPFIDEFKTAEHLEDNLEAEVNDIFTRYKFHILNNQVVLVGEDQPFYSDNEQDYGRLVIYSFNQKGQLTWAHSIDKHQEEKNLPVNLSFCSFADNDSIYLFFQDAEDNFVNGQRNKDIDTWKDNKDYVPYMCSYNLASGEANHKVKNELRIEDFTYQTGSSKQVKQGEPAYIFMKDGRDYRLCRFDL